MVRTLSVVVLLAAAAALALGISYGLTGIAEDEAAVGEPLASAALGEGPLVVYSEFGETADTLWAASPDDPKERIRLGEVKHASGYGVFPALSPDGSRIAYTALPPATARPSAMAPAELWVLDVGSGEATRLAEGVDLLTTPVWSADRDAVAVRRAAWREDGGVHTELVRVGLDGGATLLAEAEDELIPIDFSPDGQWFYYGLFGESGTDLLRAPAGGGEATPVAHVSDGIARDWRLSPDGGRLAYVAQAPADAPVAFVVRVLDLGTGEALAPLEDGAVAFNPVWDERGALTVGRLDAGGGAVVLGLDGGPAFNTPAAPPGGGGLDAPLDWSPAGEHLVVRSFESASLDDPGASRVVVVGADGGRQELSPVSDVRIAGWLEALP